MFALSMAQIASAFPTAGGLYHWASILGNRFWGWLTAWLNLLGLITVLGAINIGTAYFFAGTFGPLFGFTGTDGQVVSFVAAITVALLEGMDPAEALRFACAAGAFAATRPGAQPSAPERDQVEALLVG